mmetsp:Transcript_13377/g.20025  ORF Transcript_13377/g.20025 Transcript_13377/m.20025 type:complete len:171 (+) Transcript_13377:391-903(+)|eukprot:CAMPEP_0167758872 /NCGR_PEP_ID=MMETSP0110_2-20121227/10712_1 /TAXON_ID=629695 /ORGANISM="Gymnochlora sp., Strain CCMP2014" /LENGTH=170 /DNA_ID=CAMNT_0007645201 /DNA_START=314 /DNA_END=826 /DNA_ORIENTATION=+
MGLPGSGKTTVKKKFFSYLRDIDPDETKKAHTKWNKGNAIAHPQLDREIHQWSVREAVAELRRAVRQKEDFVLDASGSDYIWLRDQIETASENGYHVLVAYIVVPSKIALRRNHERRTQYEKKKESFKDAHYVPEYIIKRKASNMRDSFSRARRYADEVWTLVNYGYKDI